MTLIARSSQASQHLSGIIDTIIEHVFSSISLHIQQEELMNEFRLVGHSTCRSQSETSKFL